MTNQIERRATSQPVKVEQRDGGKQVLTGYGAVFYNAADPGTEYRLWDDMVERIMPGAFDRALRENQDVRCLFNHNPDHLLGRTKSGTMRQFVDSKGLGYECDKSDSSIFKDVEINCGRGDISGSSFSFIATGASWIEETRDGRTCWIRQVTDCDLFDQGPVTYPAYEATTAGVRSGRDAMDAERDAFIAERQAASSEADEVDLAAAMVEVDNDEYAASQRKRS